MKLRLTIDNGYLRFDPDSVNESDPLHSWLENMAPGDLMHGEWTVEVDVETKGWNEDNGPELVPSDVPVRRCSECGEYSPHWIGEGLGHEYRWAE
ncbi:MAG: hypothetical protein DRQ56_10535 [Gammaproteobacteria bacterium]|nr:MAG: hypothetical protein DRQ56_10535 [Gammaproteobacteria bacterium]